jgi:CIC family chloride channel protein
MAQIRSWFSKKLTSRGTAAFLFAALILGFIVGLGAAVLVWTIEFVFTGTTNLDRILEWGRWFVVLSVPVGILASWLLDRRYGPGVASGGVTEAMVGISLHGGYLPTRLIPTKILATAMTLGTGGSGGREGPIALIGATIGSSFSRYTGFGQDHIRSLVAAGAGAGIGASFNAPIAGMLFAMEVMLRSFSVRHLNAIVITSVAAAVTTRSLVGEEVILSSPPHDLTAANQLILYAILALLAVLFGLFFLRVLDITSETAFPSRIPSWVKPVTAGLAVGLIGVFAPRTLGTGQEFLSDLLALSGDGDGEYVWYALFGLAALKAVSTSLTRAGGGSVGTFMAALFIGGTIGAGFAIMVEPVWNFSEINTGAFAVVGMAATFAAVARAPLTSVIIVFEITGDYGLVLPLMLGAALATFLGDRFHADSAYTISLTRRGIHLPANQDVDLLDTVAVGDVMADVDQPAAPSMTVRELDDLLVRGHHHGVPVIDGTKLVGVVSYSDLDNLEGPSPDTTVADVMTARPITVTPAMPVSAALARMASLGLGRLPVVAEDNPKTLVGMFRRESVVRAYHHALGIATGRELYRERVRLRSQPDATFFEALIQRGSPMADAQVKDIHWPSTATLVSVRRGAAVLIPHGTTIIEPGDVLTVFGTGEAREELARLAEPTGDPTQEWMRPGPDP